MEISKPIFEDVKTNNPGGIIAINAIGLHYLFKIRKNYFKWLIRAQMVYNYLIYFYYGNIHMYHMHIQNVFCVFLGFPFRSTGCILECHSQWLKVCNTANREKQLFSGI